jgi:hypothetical protein
MRSGVREDYERKRELETVLQQLEAVVHLQVITSRGGGGSERTESATRYLGILYLRKSPVGWRGRGLHGHTFV